MSFRSWVCRVRGHRQVPAMLRPYEVSMVCTWCEYESPIRVRALYRRDRPRGR